MPQTISFHSLSQSRQNPSASTVDGFLCPFDMNYFGSNRSENLHLAACAVHKFNDLEGRYPNNNPDDLEKCVAIAKDLNDEFNAS